MSLIFLQMHRVSNALGAAALLSRKFFGSQPNFPRHIAQMGEIRFCRGGENSCWAIVTGPCQTELASLQLYCAVLTKLL